MIKLALTDDLLKNKLVMRHGISVDRGTGFRFGAIRSIGNRLKFQKCFTSAASADSTPPPS
ncbi:MAG: hypothetical protein CMM47_10605 [Rhodospirillaceae bacterium]|nr:hypothetical protein [Rhodospirillaceae bacterium]